MFVVLINERIIKHIAISNQLSNLSYIIHWTYIDCIVLYIYQKHLAYNRYQISFTILLLDKCCRSFVYGLFKEIEAYLFHLKVGLSISSIFIIGQAQANKISSLMEKVSLFKGKFLKVYHLKTPNKIKSTLGQSS